MDELITRVLTKENLKTAYETVVRNKGVGGVDNMKLSDLKLYLQENWGNLKSKLAIGEYQPKAILGIEIPKSSGGKRLLGVPTVFDRMIQQAIHQVLQPIFEPDFSNYSYGFRPRRSAGQAILQAQQFINEGYQDIIDIDLKSFFDIVNHDYLMTLLYRKIKDPVLLKLILKFLRAPIEISGKLQKRRQGVPQGSPLSPLLSNIILNELDKELELRDLRFVRYADDFSIFVKSKLAAIRVKENVKRFIEKKLHLKINEEKSSIVRPQKYEYLGYGFVSSYEKGSKGKYQLVVSKKSLKELKRKIKYITRKTIPASFDERILRLKQLMYGWVNYFKHANIHNKLKSIDSWVRSRLRYCIWHHWKKPNKRMRSFIRLGIRPGISYAWSRSRMGGWAIAQSPIMQMTITPKRLEQRGYIPFLDYYHKIRN